MNEILIIADRIDQSPRNTTASDVKVESKYTSVDEVLNAGKDPDFEPGTGRKWDASSFCCAADRYYIDRCQRSLLILIC